MTGRTSVAPRRAGPRRRGFVPDFDWAGRRPGHISNSGLETLLKKETGTSPW